MSARHASNIAAVIAKFAGRRAALVQITDPNARAAAAHQLATEETAELARLAIEHAAEKRRLRHATLATLAIAHRPARRTLRQRQRRQKIGIAVQLQALLPQSTVRSHPRATSRAVRRIGWRAPINH